MIWKLIEDFPDYEISENGEVRRCVPRRAGQTFKGKVLRCKINNKGRAEVCLFRGGKRHWSLINRLVATVFIGPPPTPSHEAAHGDGNHINNHHLNLRWATRKENQADRLLHGTDLRGEKHPSSKLTEKQAKEIISSDGNQRILAEKYGVSLPLIEKIKSGKYCWKHLHAGAEK